MNDNRARAMAYMEGWRCGAAFLPIPDQYIQNPDFSEGWCEGRAAKREATAVAEAKYGYTFAVVKPMEPYPAIDFGELKGSPTDELPQPPEFGELKGSPLDEIGKCSRCGRNMRHERLKGYQCSHCD